MIMVCISLASFRESFCARDLFYLPSVAYIFKFSFGLACLFLFYSVFSCKLPYSLPGIILGIKMHTITRSRKKGSVSKMKHPAVNERKSGNPALWPRSCWSLTIP